MRAIRPGLSAIIPLNLYQYPLKGLPVLQPEILLEPYPIPKSVLLSIWRQSCLAKSPEGLIEILFHLQTDGKDWHLMTPEQTQSASRCQTTQLYPQTAIAEIHSHGHGCAYFSSTDNAEENGFRLYGVIGRLNTRQPEILLRIGIYRHFMILPASSVFQLPDFFIDVAERDNLIHHFYTIESQHEIPQH